VCVCVCVCVLCVRALDCTCASALSVSLPLTFSLAHSTQSLTQRGLMNHAKNWCGAPVALTLSLYLPYLSLPPLSSLYNPSLPLSSVTHTKRVVRSTGRSYSLAHSTLSRAITLSLSLSPNLLPPRPLASLSVSIISSISFNPLLFSLSGFQSLIYISLVHPSRISLARPSVSHSAPLAPPSPVAARLSSMDMISPSMCATLLAEEGITVSRLPQ
jgi:hypothetical protein